MPLTVEEADRIRQQDAAGRLDRHDEAIGKLVDEANRTVSRSLIWGRGRREGRRSPLFTVLLIGGLFLTAAVVGFLLPVLLTGR